MLRSSWLLGPCADRLEGRRQSNLSGGCYRPFCDKVGSEFTVTGISRATFLSRLQVYHSPAMKISNHLAVPVYTVSGSSTARPLPEWLARKRKRSLKNDPEYASRIELLQDFEFEEASQCVRVSDDGQWVMSTGMSMQ